MAYTFFNSFQVNGKNIYGNSLSHYLYGVDVYTESSDPINNYTNVKFIPWVMAKEGVTTTTSSTYHFKNDGVTYQGIYIKLGVIDNAGYATPYHANEKIIKYYHNEDGTKTITFNFSVETEVTEGANANLNNYCFKSASITQTVNLPTINRVSPITWSGNWVMGTAKNIIISPYVSGYTHTLEYRFGSSTGSIVTKTSNTTISWTPSKDLGRQIPDAVSGVGTIICTTYNGNTKIGSVSKTFTLNVSSDTYPTFEYKITGNNLFNNLYITTKSTVKFEIINATGSYGSSIKSYSISGEGLNTSSASGTSSKFSKTGTFIYTLKVTDSRNRTTVITKSIVVYEYFSPQVTFTTLSRCDANGNASDTGNNILAVISYNIANPNSNGLNKKDFVLQYREEGSTSWKLVTNGTLTTYNSTSFTVENVQEIESAKSFEIRIGISDNFSTAYSTGLIPTSTCIFDIEPLGIGVGKYHQTGALDIAGDIYLGGHKFYETGTFNAIFEMSENKGTFTYTHQQAVYTKIGNSIHFSLSLTATYGLDGRGGLTIKGLPFVNNSVYSSCSLGYVEGVKIESTINNSFITAYVEQNDWRIIFVNNDITNSNTDYLTNERLREQLNIQVSGVYMTNE